MSNVFQYTLLTTINFYMVTNPGDTGFVGNHIMTSSYYKLSNDLM